MYPEIFSTDLFGFLSEPAALHTYGLLIATGFLVAMNLASRQAEREDEDGDRIVDMAFFLLLSGLAGSRFVFILTKWDEYAGDPAQILKFWNGGLVWYGGFIAASIYAYYFCTKHRLNYFKYADLLMPYVALAHGAGRLGCLAAGCCFGEPTDLAWGITFPADSMAAAAH